MGESNLPCDPAPGFGGILLGGVIAQHVGSIDPEMLPDLRHLTRELEDGRRIAQPRLRHRLQVDTVGLSASCHRLVGDGELLAFEFDEKGAPEQQVLGAVYAAGQLDLASRRSVMATLRRSIDWVGPVGGDLIAALAGGRRGVALGRLALENPTAWALDRLGFSGVDAPPPGVRPDAREVQRRYRELLRSAHPDHGADADGAAARIAELGEAKRILTRPVAVQR